MQRWLTINGSLFALGLVLALVALNIGPEPAYLFASHSPTTATILWDVRLPRILAALVVGAALGTAGTAYQALLRNPLADPYILGVSGGAALGAAIAVVAHLPFGGIVTCAFAISLGCMLGIYRLAMRPGRSYVHALLLTGVVFNAFAFACIMFLHAVIPMERAHEILFLLMGNLSLTDGPTLIGIAGAVIVGMALLIWRAPWMNALVLGDDTAASLGCDLRRLQWEIFFAGSLMIGACVAASGLIGFIGLFIPHAVRFLTGADHRLLVPASGLAGACALLIADTIGRTVFAGATYQTELPVGVITALVGAPCFVWLLRRQL